MTMGIKGIGRLPDEEAKCSAVNNFVRADEKPCMVEKPAWTFANSMREVAQRGR